MITQLSKNKDYDELEILGGKYTIIADEYPYYNESGNTEIFYYSFKLYKNKRYIGFRTLIAGNLESAINKLMKLL